MDREKRLAYNMLALGIGTLAATIFFIIALIGLITLAWDWRLFVLAIALAVPLNAANFYLNGKYEKQWGKPV